MPALDTATYWAHSARDRSSDPASRQGWQPLADHLSAAAALAEELAAGARPGDRSFAALARLAGLLHDYGKYSNCFQQMLATGRGSCKHSFHGAWLSYFGPCPADPRPALTHVAAAILGHHAGLHDLSRLRSVFTSEARLQQEALALLDRASRDCAALDAALSAEWFGVDLPSPTGLRRLDLTTRVLSSCLVDADRLDSARRPVIQEPLHADGRLEQLLAHIEKLAARATEGTLKVLRTRVLEDCLRAASNPSPLFSLTVPTGGGKTLAAMAFALRRAALNPERFRRIIVVIPYLSIIEQNAQVYTDIFGDRAVLEHHSGSFAKLREYRTAPLTPSGYTEEDSYRFVPDRESSDEDAAEQSGLRPETENWDAPLIVTTSVRFFESLFSNRPRDLRRVHNITRSIVILDEVQTLPRRLLLPLLDMMQELARDWGVNFVFSTATQPAFECRSGRQDSRWHPGTVTEIVTDPSALRRALRRAQIQWEIGHPMKWPQVAERVLSRPQCLAVVYLRRHAAELYAEVIRLAGEHDVDPHSVFHLSTRMCAAHRLRELKRIRQRLNAGEPCYVVSTQLVEAGVDVDFPLVLRALAPLDAIVQAAGRADREGRLTSALGRPGGDVVIFEPFDRRVPPNEYAEATATTTALARRALQEGTSIQADSAEALSKYFETYYGVPADEFGAKLQEQRSECQFATLAQQFEMISSRTRDVFVPDDEEARIAISRVQQIGTVTAELRRTLQRHVVGLNPSEFRKAREGVLFEIRPGTEVWRAAEYAYDARLGLLLEVGPENFVL